MGPMALQPPRDGASGAVMSSISMKRIRTGRGVVRLVLTSWWGNCGFWVGCRGTLDRCGRVAVNPTVFDSDRCGDRFHCYLEAGNHGRGDHREAQGGGRDRQEKNPSLWGRAFWMIGGLVDPDSRITQAVQGLGALDGGGGVLTLEDFGEAVEQTPEVADSRPIG